MDDTGKAQVAKPAYSPDGIHLLRTTLQVQYQMSQMADQKANMLLGITFLIFTIAIGQARSGAVSEPAVLILAGTAFAAALLAILAVLPSTKAPIPSDDSLSGILFFGAFSQLDEDAFAARMVEVAANHRTVYEALARDIHANGSVLSRKKYRLIGWAYRVLLVGLVLSLLAFLAPYGARVL